MRTRFALLPIVCILTCLIAIAAQKEPKIVFQKTLNPETDIEVTEVEIPYVPLSKAEIESRRKADPRLLKIAEPDKGYQYDFFLVRQRERHKILSRQHFSGGMGAGWPSAFTVFDATITNKGVFVLYKQYTSNTIQPIAIDSLTGTTVKDASVITADFNDTGRVIESGKLLVTTNDYPDVLFKYADGQRGRWTRVEGKWREIKDAEGPDSKGASSK